MIFCAVTLSSYAASAAIAESGTSARNEGGSSADAGIDSLPIKLPVVDGQDIRFRRLSGNAGLSQTSWVAQDNLGFIWLGTQYGLNRYDGYRSKVFKHESGRSDSRAAYIFAASLSIIPGRYGLAAIDFSISLNRPRKPLLTFASTHRFLAVSPPLSSGLMRITRESCGWQRPEDFTGLIPLRVKPPDILMILQTPQASVGTA